MTNKWVQNCLQWPEKTPASVENPAPATQWTLTHVHTACRHCSAHFINVCVLIWGGLRLGDELFQSHTLAGSKAPAAQSRPREERWACCFLPLNSDLTIQTRHLQLLTVETEKEHNLDNDFAFNVRHIQNPASLYENIHCMQSITAKG